MTVGQMLLKQREALGLTLEYVSQGICLRKVLIKALEDDEFSVIGSSVYVKGHLRAYAKFLDLDPNEILVAYADQVQRANLNATRNDQEEILLINNTFKDTAGNKQLEKSVGNYKMSVRERVSKKMFMIVLVFVLVIAVIVLTVRYVNGQGTSSMITFLPEKIDLTSHSDASARDDSNTLHIGVNVQFGANEGISWMKVASSDDEVLFEGVLLDGVSIDVHDDTSVFVITGNAGVVHINVNGISVDPLGEVGEVVRATITTTGIEVFS